MSDFFNGLPTEIIHHILLSFSILSPRDVLAFALTSKRLWNMLLHPEDKITLSQVRSLLPISELLKNIRKLEYQHALRIKIEREDVSDSTEILWKIARYGCTSGFMKFVLKLPGICLLYTSPSPRDRG